MMPSSPANPQLDWSTFLRLRRFSHRVDLALVPLAAGSALTCMYFTAPAVSPPPSTATPAALHSSLETAEKLQAAGRYFSAVGAGLLLSVAVSRGFQSAWRTRQGFKSIGRAGWDARERALSSSLSRLRARESASWEQFPYSLLSSPSEITDSRALQVGKRVHQPGIGPGSEQPLRPPAQLPGSLPMGPKFHFTSAVDVADQRPPTTPHHEGFVGTGGAGCPRGGLTQLEGGVCV
ncbi:hypothetical protein JCM8547_007004 [Rhodosporidiobolus lusitaniae]